MRRRIIVIVAMLILVLICGMFISCGKSKNDGSFDKSYLNNRERKESYIIGNDFAKLIKSSQSYQEQFNMDVFFKGFNDRFYNKKLAINIEEVRKIMKSATDSTGIDLKTIELAGYPTITEKQSYVFGAYHADIIQPNLETFNYNSFQRGFLDEFNNKPKLLSDSEINAVKENSIKSIQRWHKNADLAVTKEEKAKINAEFLEQNSKREAVKVLPSGLQYVVLRNGEGNKPENDTQKLRVSYVGTFIDGREFDSSYTKGRPAVFTLNEVIPGWKEGIKLMNTGSRYKFFVPPKLAYGDVGVGDIPPNAVLIFDIELLEIMN